LIAEIFAAFGDDLSDLLDLICICLSIDGNEHGAHFSLPEIDGDVGDINKETLLIQSLENGVKTFLEIGIILL